MKGDASHWSEKKNQIYGNKFRYRRTCPVITEAEFRIKRSSFKGHIVDALVLEGDEGRDKLR